MNNNIFLIIFLIISCLTSAQMRDINSIDSIYDSQIKKVNSLDNKKILSVSGKDFFIYLIKIYCADGTSVASGALSINSIN